MKTFIATFHSDGFIGHWPDMDMYIHAPSLEFAAQSAAKYLQNRVNTMFVSVEVYAAPETEDESPEEIIRYELVKTRGVERKMT